MKRVKNATATKKEKERKNAHPITHRIFARLSSKNLLGTFFPYKFNLVAQI
jgi:hypothetical protein